MTRHILRCALMILALTIGHLPALAAEPGRIIAIGDLHADPVAWRAIATHAGLIDQRGRWAGGRTTLVQMGDVPDRGPDSRTIIEDLMRLQREAPKQGGRVIALVGNHEAMVMTGDLAYVSAGEYARFADRRSEERRLATFRANREAIEAAHRQKAPDMTPDAIRAAWMAAWPPGRIELQAAWGPEGAIGRWVADNRAMALIDGTLFVHAGLSPAYADRSLEDINGAVSNALRIRSQDPGSIIHDAAGPLWYRGLAEGAEGTADTLAKALASHGAQRLVIAHTPHLKGIVSAHEGRLWRIDTGISAAYGGTPSYLEIIGNQITAHSVPRPAP